MDDGGGPKKKKKMDGSADEVSEGKEQTAFATDAYENSLLGGDRDTSGVEVAIPVIPAADAAAAGKNATAAGKNAAGKNATDAATDAASTSTSTDAASKSASTTTLEMHTIRCLKQKFIDRAWMWAPPIDPVTGSGWKYFTVRGPGGVIDALYVIVKHNGVIKRLSVDHNISLKEIRFGMCPGYPQHYNYKRGKTGKELINEMLATQKAWLADWESKQSEQ